LDGHSRAGHQRIFIFDTRNRSADPAAVVLKRDTRLTAILVQKHQKRGACATQTERLFYPQMTQISQINQKNLRSSAKPADSK
jgi:hypothetical protein